MSTPQKNLLSMIGALVSLATIVFFAGGAFYNSNQNSKEIEKRATVEHVMHVENSCTMQIDVLKHDVENKASNERVDAINSVLLDLKNAIAEIRKDQRTILRRLSKR